MAKPAEKLTLESLLQYEKQQNQILTQAQISTELKPNPHFCKQPILFDSKQTPNPWPEIEGIISKCQNELRRLKQLPLKYSDATSEYQAQKIRNEINRNKLRKYQLAKEKIKLCQQEDKERRNLEAMLNELDKIRKQAQDLGIDNHEQVQMQEQNENYKYDSASFQELEQLLQNAPKQYKQKYLESTKSSHFLCQPIDFFTLLSSKVMQTDREISFLLTKKYQEEATIQQLTTEYKSYSHKESTLQSQIVQLKKQQQRYDEELTKLQKQLTQVTDPNYIDMELVERIQLQQKINEQECKRLYLNIMKLRKLVELSGNIDAIKEAEQVLAENHVVKST